MSTTIPNRDVDVDPQRFIKNYYADAVAELAERYPEDQRHIEISWHDMFRFDRDFAFDLLGRTDELLPILEYAVETHPVPVDVDMTDVEVRLVGLNDEWIYNPMQVTRQDPSGYIGVTGELAKVTTPAKRLDMAVFECDNCGAPVEVEQPPQGVLEPTNECAGCEHRGPWRVNGEESTFSDYVKVRVETPPDETGDLQHEYIDGYLEGDLVWSGDGEHGIAARSGEDVTVYGTVEYRAKGDRGEQAALFDPYLNIQAVEFDGDNREVSIREHREEFKELAARDDAVDVFSESIAPELYQTPEWDTAMELIVAYLFGAPRIDVKDGQSIRGDIHALIVSDYGMGKSMVNEEVARYSPQCIKESVTGMSSDVGLLAAAVEDDFGDGQWTLEPGILVRANGGHVILDEIDKTDVSLERMNNALEGEQLVDVNKAGQSATYKSRVGLLATGNPVDGRFTPELGVSEQVGIDQSLLSRFDGIVAMRDHADEETDARVAERQGLAWVEAAEYQFGDREEFEVLDRVVSPEVGRAWVAYAREEIRPVPSRRQIDRIKDWYAGEVRQLNNDVGSDSVVPVSARRIGATLRFACAFARVNLRDEVSDRDVERAMDLSKRLVGQDFDGSKFVPQEARQGSMGGDADQVLAVLNRADGVVSVDEIVAESGLSEGRVERFLEKFLRDGRAMEPETGKYRGL